MSPQEEQLVLELHAKWGNRWSRIARKLPGRTDNEIKNYWRTHMRKKAQEEKKGSLMSASPSSSSSSSSNNETHDQSCQTGLAESEETGNGYSSIDPFWNEMTAVETATELGFEYNLSCNSMPSPVWEYSYPEPLWRMDDEEMNKIVIPGLTNS